MVIARAITLLSVLCALSAGARETIWGVGDNGGETFHAVSYQTDSVTGGIQEAYDACIAAGGGTVRLPRGTTQIDWSSGTGAVLDLVGYDNGISPVGVCSLVGYGGFPDSEADATALGSGTGTVDTGSTIVVEGMASATGLASGKKPVIHVQGIGQQLHHFSLMLENDTANDVDANTIGVLFETAVWEGGCPLNTSNDCEVGQHGLNNIIMEDVNVVGSNLVADGDAEDSTLGVGIELNFTLKCSFDGVEVRGWHRGVSHVEVPCVNISPDDGFCDQQTSVATVRDTWNVASNANIWTAAKIRENDYAMYFEDDYAARDITMVGSTIEGNWKGLLFDTASTRFADYHTHYENTAGASGTRSNIEFVGNGSSNYHGHAVHFEGTAATSRDIYRPASTQVDGIGPDTCYGCDWNVGATFADGWLINSYPRDDDGTFSGNITTFDTAEDGVTTDDGDYRNTGTHAFDCLMFRDSDDAGWSECQALNGTLSCATDADGVCDGTL